MTERVPPVGRSVSCDVALSPATIECVAQRVAELVREQLGPGLPERRLVDAKTVARRWGVNVVWVRAHADELGALRLGGGPRARLRFDPDVVTGRLTARRQANGRRRNKRLLLLADGHVGDRRKWHQRPICCR